MKFNILKNKKLISLRLIELILCSVVVTIAWLIYSSMKFGVFSQLPQLQFSKELGELTIELWVDLLPMSIGVFLIVLVIESYFKERKSNKSY